jgi:hypothetical protein
MRRRLTLGALVVACTGVGVPALASLLAPRAVSAPAQLSINTASPAFAVAGLVPGDAVTRCLRIRNEGDAPVALQDGAAVTGELAPYLRMTVERGTGLGEVGPSCTNFVPSGAYAYGTKAGGVPVSALTLDSDATWAAHETKSLRITIALPADAPNAAMAKQATVAFGFAGFPLPSSDGTGTPNLPGGIAPGTTGGLDKNGNFLTNKQIKKRLRIGRARLLKNGNIVVMMYLPAGGAIRAKAILPGGLYYAHTLLPKKWGPKVRVLLVRRPVGKAAAAKARQGHRRLALQITTRYRWAHGPDAFVQPEQKLVVVKGRR